MNEGASRTAQMVAAYRARESARAERLFDDPWAARLAGDEGRAAAADHDVLNPSGALYVVVRTVELDAIVRAHVRRGVAQVVLLGAGLDARAARLATAGVRFFEVDHPETQALKLARLRALDGYPVGAATYVPCDFESDDPIERLASAGLDVHAPAVVVWEGVTMYLTEPAVRATLRRVATGCDPRTAIAFDLVGKRMAQGRVDEKDAALRGQLDGIGEPIRWGTDDVLPLLYEEGFRHVRVRSFDELALEHTGTYERARKFRFQHLALASVGGAP